MSDNTTTDYVDHSRDWAILEVAAIVGTAGDSIEKSIECAREFETSLYGLCHLAGIEDVRKFMMTYLGCLEREWAKK